MCFFLILSYFPISGISLSLFTSPSLSLSALSLIPHIRPQSAVFRVPVEVQQQLQSERARNEEMAADLRALMDRFVRLKNEQVGAVNFGSLL